MLEITSANKQEQEIATWLEQTVRTAQERAEEQTAAARAKGEAALRRSQTLSETFGFNAGNLITEPTVQNDHQM